MQKNKFNILLDQAYGSSGKGKMSAYLADHYNITKISSSNYPNAGHTAKFSDGTTFVAKAIPTAAILKKFKGTGIQCWISPGSGFNWKQLLKEWVEAGKPEILIHERASIVTDQHKAQEEAGASSTKHLASTMQGTAAAITDKILRKQSTLLARTSTSALIPNPVEDWARTLGLEQKFDINQLDELIDSVKVINAWEFRQLMRKSFDNGHTWLHEGSQGYALSIDHGSHYPFCTSRNCTLQAAMDHMAVPPSLVGDVYLNLRSFPIRVGNVVEDGKQMGYSGDFYPDSKELNWEQIANDAGMPEDKKKILAERERTTVTKRIRRVATFSWEGLKDAVQTNGATKICVNFVQYFDWKDAGIKGGKEALEKLSSKSRHFIDRIEEVVNVPVVLIGTGALHDEVISLL